MYPESYVYRCKGTPRRADTRSPRRQPAVGHEFPGTNLTGSATREPHLRHHLPTGVSLETGRHGYLAADRPPQQLPLGDDGAHAAFCRQHLPGARHPRSRHAPQQQPAAHLLCQARRRGRYLPQRRGALLPYRIGYHGEDTALPAHAERHSGMPSRITPSPSRASSTTCSASSM